MSQKLYRPNKLRLYSRNVFRGLVFTCFALGIVVTGGTIYGLAKYYLVDKPNLNRQRREYAEAIIHKERREKELGLRD